MFGRKTLERGNPPTVSRVWSKLIALTAAASAILIAVGTAWAWDRTFTSAPLGYYWLSTSANYQGGIAQNLKWDSSALSAMRSDSSPRLDMTADCTADNPGGDRLNYNTFYTNLPNYGISVWDDCGNRFVYEEAELGVNPWSVVANTEYYFQVFYYKNQRGVSGAINISYQRNNSPTHDWLDKVLYTN
jgi:hypothetical protein